MKNPLVSIIIPTFNRAHLIGETLDSVLAQNHQNWECLVVDDGSTDNTAAVLAGYIAKDSRIQYHHRPKDRRAGGNEARNYGFEISRGEYVQWFDDDDIMLPHFLVEKCLAFKKNIDFVICSGFITDESLAIEKSIKMDEPTSLFKDYLLWELMVLTPSVLFKRSFLKDKKLFDPNIHRGQETEFFARIFFRIPPERYKIIRQELFLYRQHNYTKTELNKTYNSDFKYSQSFVYVENLKRSIEIKDDEMINYCFQSLLGFFFLSLSNKDSKTSRYIYGTLLLILKDNYFKLYLEFKLIGRLLLIYNDSSYRVEQRWKQIWL